MQDCRKRTKRREGDMSKSVNRIAAIKKMLPVLSVVVFVVVVIDQLTKRLVVGSLTLHEEISIIPGIFNLTLVYNKGVAFGMGSGLSDGARQIVLSLATLVAVLAVIYFLMVDYLEDRVAHFAIALILGGALGNVIDRVFIGSVVDFLDFYYGAYHWPAFNVADSAIFIGVFILVFHRPVSERAGLDEAAAASQQP
jgi:signal peptidase II